MRNKNGQQAPPRETSWAVGNRAPARSLTLARGIGFAGPIARPARPAAAPDMRFFSFLYLKKIKISKIYVRFEIFQNYPRSPYGGRQALSVIFFFKFATRSLAKKIQGGPLTPPNRRHGPVAHPRGDRVPPPYI